ncbi:DNA polymerase IV [Auritidibacter ignavus]|uniref:DNA polymerase IV n=2 Tax=Auritidibacter TaxID=1160973 RepID=UPI00169E24A0|nr:MULTISPECIES: DNA polymerase IV [Auritidibacter]NIH70359.1 DNA polymerase-4 [Auritidibacter ignavus]WGH82360.1 DNA polymerase IV [Auritidibacter ignavus]WGH91554.1 DNA polymerase IV [Auritidibacter ignavus]WHS27720.1 DNA polymerase IV [Auritidibacter ignavus]
MLGTTRYSYLDANVVGGALLPRYLPCDYSGDMGAQTDRNQQQDPSWDSTILHIDMDAFFLSVELLQRPELAGKPAVVAHHGPRSVVTSASYEARAYGIKSAMPLAHAQALYPQVEVLEPHREKYTAISAQLTEIWTSFTPLVERLSIDEAFLDISGARRRLGPPAEIAVQVKEAVRERTGLAATVGVAMNKSVAKIASTRSKPDGLGVVPAIQTAEYLAPLPVNVIWGVGPKLFERFQSANILTVGDLATQDPQRMRRWLGVVGPDLVQLARGIDPRPVVPQRDSKSVGVEHTFDQDLVSAEQVHRYLLDLSYECARRLRSEGAQARGIVVKVKDDHRATRNKSRGLRHPTASGAQIVTVAEELLAELMQQRWHPLRLLGVRGERLIDADSLETSDETATAQEALFSWHVSEDSQPSDRRNSGESLARTDAVMDEIHTKFPDAGLKPATLLKHHRQERIGEDSE